MKYRVISNKKDTSLVEWDDGRLHRAYVPRAILDGEVSSDILSEGIPYGVDLFVTACVTPDDLEDELHRSGIWTTEDVRVNANLIARVARKHDVSLGEFWLEVLGR